MPTIIAPMPAGRFGAPIFTISAGNNGGLDASQSRLSGFVVLYFQAKREQFDATRRNMVFGRYFGVCHFGVHLVLG